ncbi:hypothetical protein JJP45_25765 [Bacillus cereus]|nr:aromatic acid exporter family protein [Bacillus cereus]MBK4744379.1 hypothetical protein [Bacillus cereus]
MNQDRKWNIVGGKVIKTGIAVFLTVLVCEFFNISTWSYKNDLKDYKPNHYHHHFSSEYIILFEVLSINDMLEELKQISEKYEWGNRFN